MAQLPDALGERLERQEIDGEAKEIAVGGRRLQATQLACPFQSSQDIRRFNQDEVRSAQMTVRDDPLRPHAARATVGRDGDEHRGVDDRTHRRSAFR